LLSLLLIISISPILKASVLKVIEMKNILSADELTELTGAKNSKRQIEVLVKHGIKFITRSDGKIRTTWGAVDAVLATQVKINNEEPNLDFLRR
jgi:hypothetical protein